MEEKAKDQLKPYAGSVLAQGYGVVGKLVMRDRRLKIGAKGLYCYLCTYGQEVFPKRDTILYDLGIGKDTYTSYMKELVRFGYVKVQQQRKEGNKFAGNIYTINIKLPDKQSVEPCPKKSDAENDLSVRPCPKNPYTEKRDTEKPHTEKADTGQDVKLLENKGVTELEMAANSNNSNSTRNNQYKNTTTVIDKDKKYCGSGGLTAVGELLPDIMKKAETNVVVDDEIRDLITEGEKQHIDKHSILKFVQKYGKEAVKVQLSNLLFANKDGKVGNPGGWLNCALLNGYSNYSAEKAQVKRDNNAKAQAAIKKMLEEDAKRPVPEISEDNVFYQVYLAHHRKNAEG